MAQFNAESLSRLLTQVEREVLVEAVERAGIDFLFTSPARETIEELAGYFNLLANFRIFGPKLLQEGLFQELEKILESAGHELGIDGGGTLFHAFRTFLERIFEEAQPEISLEIPEIPQHSFDVARVQQLLRQLTGSARSIVDGTLAINPEAVARRMLEFLRELEIELDL